MRYCLICKGCYDDEVSFCEADGAQTAQIMPGSRVLDGKYEIERLLGQGGMGAVFVANQRGIERHVAVKLINPSFVSNEQALERFKREALASGRVKHPNAITVYDFGVTEAGVAYLAMEYLKGTSLRDELQQVRVMDVKRVVEILVPVCAAIESAHRQNIVHRDLKPDNIFLESLDDGSVAPKVLDFGIAKLRTAQPGAPDLTGEGSSIGTPAYMSPEQAKGLHLDARSDIYSLGVIAYEMLSGALPFQSASPMGFLVQHMMEAPIPLTAANPGISGAVEEVVMRALDKSPGARPASALEFARQLASVSEESSSHRATSAIGLQETVSFMRKLGADTIAAGRATMVDASLLGWPVGVAPGVAASRAASAFAELARELVAAAVQRVPYDVVFRGACKWAERQLSPAGLRAPNSLEAVPGSAARTAGLALYCAREGLAWCAQMPSGAELPLLLRNSEDTEPIQETIPGVTQYYAADLPGGHLVKLVARSHGQQVWASSIALVDGATSLVLCVPQPDATATQNPGMFALLFGTLELTSNEQGGEIFVDDGPVPWGATLEGTPTLLYCIVPGPHTVAVRKEYFQPFRADVVVAPGEKTTVSCELVRGEARVTIRGNAPGSVVEIVGPEPAEVSQSVTIPVGHAPVPLTLSAGVYSFRCTHAGHAPWMAEHTLRPGSDLALDVALRPIACPVCGQPAGEDTFVCPSCKRPDVHAYHRYDQSVCIDCAARAAFDRARGAGTLDAWNGFLATFRGADPRLTRQAELEIRQQIDHARESELAERAERFGRLAARREIADVVGRWRQKAIEQPRDAEAHFAFAMALEASGDRAGALVAYRKAAELASQDAFIHREYGRALNVSRQVREAVGEYTTAVRLKPDFAVAHFELANILATSGQHDAALEGFRLAAASRPQVALYHEGYGRALAHAGRYRDAAESFRLASAGYRRDGSVQRAVSCDQWAQNAIGQTAVHRAGKFLKELFE